MFNKVMKKVFGSKGEREIKKLDPMVEGINALEDKMKALGDDDFPALTEKFRERIAAGEKTDDILPEAFAAVREVAWRTLGLRHFDVQLIGGYVLHKSKISEMKTGEGKTLMATLPLYLNALTGKGAHLVTVNDYLAKRDARWMGPIYHALGMSVSVIQHDASFLYDPLVTTEDLYYQLRPVSRSEGYGADITYGTNNEFGFDYLRDNMKFSLDEYVQRDLHYAIVDEVDSILIDEARTPLIISGPTEDSPEKYYEFDKVIPDLTAEEDFTVDEKSRQIFFTDDGISKVEEILDCGNLYDPSNLEALHHVNQALRAHVLFERDVDYVVKEDQVIIVDEFTGRLMEGRRWSDGLHQAIEAKEGVKIENENQTLATITFQNYFRMYEKLAGMTGTADTEAGEFYDIYGLEVVVIPTNKPMIRADTADLVYKNEAEKFDAVVQDIRDNLKTGRPTLVGTISIDNSEKLAKRLKREGIKHNVLNAKQHEGEAEIIAQAGRIGSATISTNMAGRGTDIVLGGNPVAIAEKKAGKDESTDEYKRAFAEAKTQCEKEREEVLALGGLYILGTERHESRRIDNQLRGRSGRQGDPGMSRFYVSLEDDLMRIFGSERISGIMSKLGMEEGVPIEHGLVSKAIENAQKKVEAHNFDMRKHLLEYDDVMNLQREVVYGYRRQILSRDGLDELLNEFTTEVAEDIVNLHIEEKSAPEDWDLNAISEGINNAFDMSFGAEDITGVKKKEEIIEKAVKRATSSYKAKVDSVGDELFSQFERYMMLTALDSLWKDHLLSMDHLKAGIGLRGYGQKNPLNEYKKEGFELFADMIFRMKSEVVERLHKVQIKAEAAPEELIPHSHSHDITESTPEGTIPEPKEQLSPEGRYESDLEPDKPMGFVPASASSSMNLAPKEQKMRFNRGEGATEPEAAEKKQPMKRDKDKVGRNDPCTCGSGKKYKKCCGK